ncbi:MAG: cytochrome c oxidase subunit II [Elusimicrobia bacterium]|nr:cytochrome c oxidase subunit II [Elusimicrobiota bacterium]
MSLSIDRYFLGSLALCLAVLLLVTFFIVYFSIRYSRARNPRPEDIEGNAALEVVWTVVPLALFLVMFYFGWTDFRTLRNPPPDALAVQVTARQWSWSFEYPNGKRTGELYAALGRPMRLELRSADVIHGFYVPAFRVKIDVVPGRTATAWFLPRLLGDFDILCSVICGTSHSAMLSKVRVLAEDEFKRWYFSDDRSPRPANALSKGGRDARPPDSTSPRAAGAASGGRAAPRPSQAGRADRGAALLGEKGCLSCHSVDGSTMVGPTFKGLFGSRQKVAADGKEQVMTADEAFLRAEILEPDLRVIDGYPAVMPPSELDAGEADAIVSHLKRLAK